MPSSPVAAAPAIAIGPAPEAATSGYVRVEDAQFHVARTPVGAVVSLVQWRSDERGQTRPRLNLFAVTPQQYALAVAEFDDRLRAGASAQDLALANALQGDSNSPRSLASAGRRR